MGGRMLVWSLHHRVVMLIIAALVTASAAFLYPYVGKELVPDDDQGEFSINVRLPRGTSYQRTEEFIDADRDEVLAPARNHPSVHQRQPGQRQLQHRDDAARRAGRSRSRN